MPPTPPKAVAARRLWGVFERWHTEQQKAANARLGTDIRNMDVLWRSSPSAHRDSKLKHDERKQQMRLQSDKDLATKARAEWTKRLGNARLVLEDWSDITQKEQEAVTRILRPDLFNEEDNDEDESEDSDLDVEGMRMMDKMLNAPPAPQPSRSASQSQSYDFVPPMILQGNGAPRKSMLDDGYLNGTELGTAALQMLGAVETDSEGPETASWTSWIAETPQSSSHGSPLGPIERLPAAPYVNIHSMQTLPPTSTTTSSASSLAKSTSTHFVSASSSSITRSAKPRMPYIGAIVSDADDEDEQDPIPAASHRTREDEEASFEEFKMEIRIAKIREFHHEAAEVEINLAQEILRMRDLNRGRDEEEKMVAMHQERMLRLQRTKEEERKKIIATERSRRRDEIRGRKEKERSTSREKQNEKKRNAEIEQLTKALENVDIPERDRKETIRGVPQRLHTPSRSATSSMMSSDFTWDLTSDSASAVSTAPSSPPSEPKLPPPPAPSSSSRQSSTHEMWAPPAQDSKATISRARGKQVEAQTKVTSEKQASRTSPSCSNTATAKKQPEAAKPTPAPVNEKLEPAPTKRPGHPRQASSSSGLLSSKQQQQEKPSLTPKGTVQAAPQTSQAQAPHTSQAKEVKVDTKAKSSKDSVPPTPASLAPPTLPPSLAASRQSSANPAHEFWQPSRAAPAKAQEQSKPEPSRQTSATSASKAPASNPSPPATSSSSSSASAAPSAPAMWQMHLHDFDAPTPRPTFVKPNMKQADGVPTSSRTTLEQMPLPNQPPANWVPPPAQSASARFAAAAAAKARQQHQQNQSAYWVPTQEKPGTEKQKSGSSHEMWTPLTGSSAANSAEATMSEKKAGKMKMVDPEAPSKPAPASAPASAPPKPAAATASKPAVEAAPTAPEVQKSVSTSSLASDSSQSSKRTAASKAKGKAKGKGKGKKVTIEEVSDTEDNVTQVEHLPVDSKAILEPKPSAPPGSFESIIQYEEEGGSSSLDVLAARAFGAEWKESRKDEEDEMAKMKAKMGWGNISRPGGSEVERAAMEALRQLETAK